MMSSRSIPLFFLDTLRPVYLAALIFIVAQKWVIVKWPTEGAALLGAALTVSSVVVGFLISAKAIILGNSGRAMQQLKEMNLLVELVDAFRIAIYLAMTFSIVCTIGFFLNASQGPDRLYVSLWLGIGFAMLYSFLKICNLLFRIVGSG